MCLRSLVFLSLLVVTPVVSVVGADRRVVEPLPGHPGNVYMMGDEVTVPVPASVTEWRASDYNGKVVSQGQVGAGEDRITLGRLPIGWYRIDFGDAPGTSPAWTTAAVIARPAGPTPSDSPVCVDSATSWFSSRYRDHEEATQEAFANLAALAGANWIRDRLSWGAIETEQGRFAEESLYDSSASLQAKHGLKVLQVFHSTPGWAVDKTLDGQAAWQRFARDLRTHYAFCKAMAERFKGNVVAWEPWNEANIAPFGGHTIDEMCSMQKAAYLGFKAGDPDVTVCWNVYAGSGSALHTEGVLANEAWPYFETYNIHSYSPPDRYLDQFETARQAASGRPLWITECGIRLQTKSEPPWGDLAPDDERRQAEFVARSYASSLFSGVSRHFFFILGNYIERGVQFGLLRHDQTPRPGYVALAAVGRFLSGARCLGRVSPTVYAFRARPDGKPRDVLAAWGDGVLPEGLEIEAVYDHLGRPLDEDVWGKLSDAAMFVILPEGGLENIKLESPPKMSSSREGTPSSVVLQVSLPRHTTRLGSQAHEVEPGRKVDLPVFAYNFSDKPVTGKIAVAKAPTDWHVALASERIELKPMARQQIPVSVTLPDGGRELADGGWVHLRGDFDQTSPAMLAFRLAADLEKLRPAETHPIQAGDHAENWQDNIVHQGRMSHGSADPAGVLFEMQFADTDPWAYPRLDLAPEDVPGNKFDALALTVQLLEGTGTVRVQFIEANGASYMADAGVDPDNRSPQRALVRFRDCRWGSFSKRDSDGRLQPANIRTILVGINSRQNTKVQMMVCDLEWRRF
ncbi:MAG: hypothetical protein ISR77_38280 [Pirellulaceae bacterium]|nr:hypothetical protein [Pirellulaceae bacterium]